MRRTYKYDTVLKAMVEIECRDLAPAPRVHIQTGAHYAGLVATDGTRVDTPRRHRNYMRDHGVALYQDYEQTFAKAQEERERERMGVGTRDETILEDLKESYERVRAGYKPPPRPEVDEEKAAVVTSYIVGKDV